MVTFELTEQEKELLVRAEKIDSLLVEVRELVAETDKFAKKHNLGFISDELEDVEDRMIGNLKQLVKQMGWNSSSIGCY